MSVTSMNHMNKLVAFGLVMLLSVGRVQAHIHGEHLAGGLLGAGAGLGVSAITSGQLLTGSAIGGVLGALIGQNVGEHNRDISEQLARTGVKIVDDVYGTSLLISSDRLFEANDEPLIRAEYFTLLNKIIRLLDYFPHAKMTISGHTDGTYRSKRAVQRSEYDAFAVANYFLARGVSPQRIFAVTGKADREPVLSNVSFYGRAANRRIEITIHAQVP